MGDGSRGNGSSGKDHRRAHQIPAGDEADEEKAGDDAGDEACDEAERLRAGNLPRRARRWPRRAPWPSD